MWEHLITLGNVTFAEKIIRPVIIYFFLIVGLRLAGKRELAQLNPFDLVVLLTLSNTVQNAIIGEDNSLIGGMIGAVSLFAVNFITVRVLFRHPKLERIVEGQAVLLIEGGKIHKERMKQEVIDMDELKGAARRQGIQSLHDVDEARLEASGGISFVKKEPTAEMLRYQELLKKLEGITGELQALRKAT
jgi:uncharacterized membrane protein YcaP (DUF421 family)